LRQFQGVTSAIVGIAQNVVSSGQKWHDSFSRHTSPYVISQLKSRLTQQTVEAFHGARSSHYLFERFTDLPLHSAKVLDAATPMPEPAQRRQIGALPAPGLMSLGAVMPGAGDGVERRPAAAHHVSPPNFDPPEFLLQRRQ
jgi:hypothetical protein